MTIKKFTDEEIINIKAALEEEIHLAEYVDSDYCSNTDVSLLKSTLDLINSQKEEIDRLKSQCENTQIGYNFLKSDFERLKGSTIVNNIMEIQRIKREAKAEAYKEFAERLKEKLGDCYIVSDGEYCGFDCGDIHRTITNLLKEMVGETDD